MSYERIILVFEGSVASIRLNHPEVLNAIGAQMVDEFSEALSEVEDPGNGARCLLLAGEGRAFCSGANLADSGRSKKRGGARENLRHNYHPLLCALRDLEMPIVSAVHGPAAGVGMSFAIMADIVCASKEGYFLQAFARSEDLASLPPRNLPEFEPLESPAMVSTAWAEQRIPESIESSL